VPEPVPIARLILTWNESEVATDRFGVPKAMGKAFILAVMLCALRANASTEQLSLSSQIQYSRVIQGATDPVNAHVYNNAAPGSDTGNYSVTAAYAPPGASAYTGIGLLLF
jgi:hypothetical protein